MSYAKYYVWVGGSWRELDCASGRVAGWRGRARFVVCRGGRLRAVRAARTLVALAALAAGERSAVRDGPRLPQRRYVKQEASRSGVCVPPASSGRHRGYCRCALGHNSIPPPPAPVSASAPVPAPAARTAEAGVQCSGRADAGTLTRAHNSPANTHTSDSSQDSLIKPMSRAPTTRATRSTRDAGGRGARSSSDEALAVMRAKRSAGERPRASRAAVRSELTKKKAETEDTDSSEADFDIKTKLRGRSAPRIPNVSISTKRKRNESDGSDDASDAVVFVKETQGRAKIRSPRRSQRRFAKKTKYKASSDSSGSESSTPKPPKTGSRGSREAAESTRTTRSGLGSKAKISAAGSSGRANEKLKSHPKRVSPSDTVRLVKIKTIQKPSGRSERGVRSGSVSSGSSGPPAVAGGQAGAAWLELSIPEREVDLLRGYLERSGAGDLYRFDSDEEYRRAMFYAINPIVSVERCARLERALAQRFAERLGLRSVSGASPVLDRRHPRDSSDTGSDRRDASDSKMARREQAETDPRVRLASGRSVAASRDGGDVVKTMFSSGDRDGSRRVGRGPSSTHCKENVPQRANRQPRGAPAAPAANGHTISKRSMSGGKEYSNLEDHAIVAWVSSGARARRVNGNQLWRELQEQYSAITGTKRSWHSLRNRYLRYILPALGALRLPPADASRLRAAAATGELKGKRMAQRRNSIFDKEPAVHGASTRPPAPPRAPSTDDTDHDAKVAATKRRALRSSGAGAREGAGRIAPASASASAPAPAPPSAVSRSSPRYSDVTRQFAMRKLRSTPRDEGESLPLLLSGEGGARNTRRLYNPRALL